MSEQLLTILKLCLLALLYLFFFRVLRAVWTEVRASGHGHAHPVPAAAAAPAAAAQAPAPAAAPAPTRGGRGVPVELHVLEPEERRGTAFPIADELTVGRAGGCAVSLPDDTFVSTLHARIFRDEGGRVFVEDLGSTNGTFLNRAKVTAPVALGRGDRLQVGNTVLEAR